MLVKPLQETVENYSYMSLCMQLISSVVCVSNTSILKTNT